MSLARIQSLCWLVGHDAETAVDSLSLGLECVCDTEHVSGRRIWSVVGAARALCLLPTGYNVTARRPGAFPVFADQSGAGSPVLYL